MNLTNDEIAYYSYNKLQNIWRDIVEMEEIGQDIIRNKNEQSGNMKYINLLKWIPWLNIFSKIKNKNE